MQETRVIRHNSSVHVHLNVIERVLARRLSLCQSIYLRSNWMKLKSNSIRLYLRTQTEQLRGTMHNQRVKWIEAEWDKRVFKVARHLHCHACFPIEIISRRAREPNECDGIKWSDIQCSLHLISTFTFSHPTGCWVHTRTVCVAFIILFLLFPVAVCSSFALQFRAHFCSWC